MKNIREIIRLYTEQELSQRKISLIVNVSRPVISEYIKSFKKTGLSYNDIKILDDDALLLLLVEKKTNNNKRYKVLSDRFEYMAHELKKRGVTLTLLWEEYKKEYPNGYSLSQFLYHYQVWRGSSEITMHIEHKAGDKLYVDYAGKKLQLTDRLTGEQRDVNTFIAVLGASQLTYVEVTETQKTHDWIKATEGALWYIGGVPKAIVPDCYKSAVVKADKYEPAINPGYNSFARHYGITILPARPGKPKDKALVENAVKIVYNRIYAALRNQTFYSLQELNKAILEKLKEYNSRKMQKLKKSRKELFEEIEKNELKNLPTELYEQKEFAKIKVQFNYHIYLSKDYHYYSVPYQYRGKKVDVIYTFNDVEIYYKNIRIAFHRRKRIKNGYSTLKSHMPSSHQWVASWSKERIISWASKIGENVKSVVETILLQKEHPEQGFKVCLGIINLSKKYSNIRVDKACKKVIYLKYYTLKSIKNILENNLEDEYEQPDLFPTLPQHENIRGNKYYN